MEISQPDGVKTVGWPDPKYPDLYFFEHEKELRWLDTKTLFEICFKKAVSKKINIDNSREFANWACETAIEKINNGNTIYGHLNKAPWLWSEWLQLKYGAKNPNSNRALQYQKTVSYDNSVNDDGDTFRDLIPDTQSPDQEQKLLLKEKLITALVQLKADCDEQKKVIQLKNHPKKILERERRVYQFLLGKIDSYYCTGIYHHKILAQECAIGLKEFKAAIANLVEKRRLCIKGDFFFMPDEFITDDIA